MIYRCGVTVCYAATALLLGAGAEAGDVYKTVDAQGHVTYSDRPLSSTSQSVALQVTPPNPEEAARLAREQALQTADAAQEAQQAQKNAAEQQKKIAEEAAQKQRCDSARNRYLLFAAGGRLLKTDEQGNRVYYSDDEIAAEVVASKAAMDSACSQ
jgi:hypothetical protein